MASKCIKSKNSIIKFSTYDLFKQNTNINRKVSGTSIVDTRTNKLTRYFMVTFTYRLQKFVGQAAGGGGTEIFLLSPDSGALPGMKVK